MTTLCVPSCLCCYGCIHSSFYKMNEFSKSTPFKIFSCVEFYRTFSTTGSKILLFETKKWIENVTFLGFRSPKKLVWGTPISSFGMSRPPILMDCSAMVVSGLARGQKPSFKRIKLGCAINVITKRQQKFLWGECDTRILPRCALGGNSNVR